MKKLIRYRLSISRFFPATHKRKGEETNFTDKIYRLIGDILEEKHGKHALIGIKDKYSINGWWNIEPKIHTIRSNYPLWQKRFEKINKGEAVLELYYWSGKPYNSKCITICQLGKNDGIGVQRIDINPFGIDYNIDFKGWVYGEGHILSKNDGLSEQDMKEWFRNYDLSEPMAIIHFTKFRY